nr:unnamed protein product [Callosobruchus chinensis]
MHDYLQMFKLWMNCIGNKILQHLDPIEVYNNYRVCHAHFSEGDEYTNNRLRKDAVPSLNIPIPQIYSSIEQIVDQLPTAAMPPTQPVVEMPLIATTPTTAQQNSNQVEQIEKQSSNPSSSRSGSGFLSYVSVSRESHLSPRAKRLYRVANRLSRANRRLKARRLFQRTRVSNSELLNEALQNLDSCVATFIKSQISLAGRISQGRRYNLEEKLMGLILYKQSGKGYKALSKFFALPGRKTIRQLLHKIPINPGLNEVIFNNLTEVAAGLDENSKYCCLMFDEISLDPHIDLNVVKQEFEGFETNDEPCRSAVIADHALVFLIRGLVRNWKQPLAYTFCKSSTKTVVLVRLIKKIIMRCQQAGLKVLCTICDQGATNQAAISYLMKYSVAGVVDPTRKYFFKIIHIYDPPHLIKGIRNNLLTKNLVWESPEQKIVARWSDIEAAYAIDNAAGSLRAMPKLTDCHINRQSIKKMKVSCATQVLSHTVASVMSLMARAGVVGVQGEKLTETAVGTAQVLKFFDNLMDSVNGHSLYPTGGKRLRCAVSRSTDHFAFWTDARQSLRRMYYQAEGSEERIRPPSLVNWTITINGIVDIFEMLECENVNILKCRWLNQDPIENFFGQIRQQGIRDTNPTCNHFKNHFKTLLINNFSSRHSMSSNCEDDETKNVILAVKKIVTQDVIPTTTDLGTFSVHIPPQRMTYMSKVSLGYVSGFMTKYVKKYISACANCKGSIFSENPVDEWHDLIRAKEYLHTVSAKLKYCHPDIVRKFAQIYNIVIYVLSQLAYRTNCLTILINFVSSKVSLPLNCPNHGNSLNGILINKFITFICYNWTVGINRTLSGKDLRCSNNDPIIQQAREIYLKHRRHRK